MIASFAPFFLFDALFAAATLYVLIRNSGSR